MCIRSLLVLLFLVVLCAGLMAAEAPTERCVIRIDNPDRGMIKVLAREGFDILAVDPGRFVDIVGDFRTLSGLQARGLGARITKTESQALADLRAADGRPVGYTTYDQMLETLETYPLLYPNICSLVDLGETWGWLYDELGLPAYQDFSHRVWALKVSDNPTVEEDEPSVYFMGTHHAREPISLEVTLHILQHIVGQYGEDPQITADVSSKQIWFIPLVNPDGHKIVMDETDIWWRKNVRDNNDNHSFDTDYNSGLGPDGVDINRNYGFTWGDVGATDDPSGVTYHGPEAFSEPETQHVRDLIEAHHFVAGISYHSYGELVLIPYGYANDVYGPDNIALTQLGNAIASQIEGVSGGTYTAQPSWNLYPTSGGSDDWAYGVHGIFAYTVELAEEFIPPQQQIDGICQANLQGALILLQRIDSAAVTGHITDDSGSPIVAEIRVEGIDNTGAYRMPYLSDQQFGRYYRMLPEGLYTFRFQKYGYSSVVTDNVIVLDGMQTEADAVLHPVEAVSVTGQILDAETLAPIPGVLVAFQEIPVASVLTDESGYFSFDSVYLGEYDLRLDREGYGIRTLTVDLNTGTNIIAYLNPPYYTDDFESATPAWQTTGEWGISNSVSYNGSQSLTDSPGGPYPNNASAQATLNQIFNFGENDDPTVSFMTLCDLEAGYDFVNFQYKIGQTPWVTLESISGESDWSRRTYDLGFMNGAQNVRFRFQLTSDQYIAQDGIYIDDFSVFVHSDPQVNWGDVNDDGEITVTDAELTLVYAVGGDPLPGVDPRPWDVQRVAAADVSGNGVVDAWDASLIRQKSLGLITEFPVEAPGYTYPECEISYHYSNGELRLYAHGVLEGFSFEYQPQLGVYLGQPESEIENLLESIQTSEDGYTYGLAAASGFNGHFLTIPLTLDNPGDNLSVSMRVNNDAVILNVVLLSSHNEETPLSTRLRGNYPNPFNPETVIEYSLATPEFVEITVYNLRGQRVGTLVDKHQVPGRYTVVWDGKDQHRNKVSSGIYFIKMRTRSQNFIHKCMLLK